MNFLRTCFSALAVLCLSAAAYGQALPAASRAGDLQVGVGVSYGRTDIFDKAVSGISAYGTFDVGEHLGVEADVHLMILTTPDDFVEDTYLAGVRYKLVYGRYQPYLKALAGIGTTKIVDNRFEFVVNTPSTNLATALGAGVDIQVTHHVNVRGDLEYQIWPSFGPHALNPVVATVGAAYRFR